MSRENLRAFSTKEWLLSLLLAVTWGSSFLLIAVAIEFVDPAVVPFGRSMIGCLVLTIFPGARDRIPREHWPRIAMLGLVWMAIPFWLFPLAELTVTSGIAGMINGGLPVVMACVTAIWVRRLPSVRRLAAITIGFVGIFAISLPAIRTKSPDGNAIADLKGMVLLFVAVFCYAIGANLARPLQAIYTPARLLARVQFSAALWTLPFALLGLSKSQFSWTALAAIFALGVIGTGFAFVAFGTLLERAGLARAMIPTYFTPVVGLLLGAFFRNEHIATLSVVGMFIVIVSAWLTSKPDIRDVTLNDAIRER